MSAMQSRGGALIALGVVFIVTGATMASTGSPKGDAPWLSLYDDHGNVVGGPTTLAVDSAPPASAEPSPLPTPAPAAPTSATPEPSAAASSPPVPTEPSADVPSEPRLLRSHGVLLFDDGGSAGRSFRWTTTDARTATVTIRAFDDGEIAAEVAVDGEPAQIATFRCGAGVCSVLANQREDGALLLRFKSDAYEDDVGSVACVLAALDESSGTFGPSVQSRWEGTPEEYGSGVAPSWTKIAPERGARIPTDSVPAVSCTSESECLRMASTQWMARNHRYVIAYAREAIGIDAQSVRALYMAAAAYGDAGDVEHAVEFLTQLSLVGTRDASSALRRAARDDAFEAARGDSRFQALVSASAR